MIEESATFFQNKPSFLFFLQPKNSIEMVDLLKTDHFTYPVFIYTANRIEQLNHFPSKDAYRCFLLDKDNKVLMVGNPVLNTKIWELYKQIMSGKRVQIKTNLRHIGKSSESFLKKQAGF